MELHKNRFPMEWEEQLMQTCKWKELRKQLVLPIKKKEREEQLVEPRKELR